MESCVFCKIAVGEIAAAIILQDELAVSFKDIQPQAPLHAVVIPRRHIASLNERP